MQQEKESREGELLSDEAIIDLYWNRDEKAIDETDRKYRSYLYKIAYNIVHDRLDCEECLNDTYLGTWNRIPPTKPNIFQVFLARIMRNIAVDRLRKTEAEKRVSSEMIVSLDELEGVLTYERTPEETMQIAEISRVLNDFLYSLEAREEFVFICRYYYADCVSEIARMLELSPSTVYRELESLRARLKERLEKGGIDT